MGELIDFLKNRYIKKVSISDDQMSKTVVKNSIISLCEEYLVDLDCVLEFEVLPSSLPYAVTVIDEEPLCTKYCINQISKSVFRATLKSVDI